MRTDLTPKAMMKYAELFALFQMSGEYPTHQMIDEQVMEILDNPQFYPEYLN